MKTKPAILSEGAYCRRGSVLEPVFAVAPTCLAAVVVVAMICTMDRYPGHPH